MYINFTSSNNFIYIAFAFQYFQDFHSQISFFIDFDDFGLQTVHLTAGKNHLGRKWSDAVPTALNVSYLNYSQLQLVIYSKNLPIMVWDCKNYIILQIRYLSIGRISSKMASYGNRWMFLLLLTPFLIYLIDYKFSYPCNLWVTGVVWSWLGVTKVVVLNFDAALQFELPMTFVGPPMSLFELCDWK